MHNSLFKKWNDWGGWIVFLIAAIVYGITIEPTASFWDCPEFISCAEKLQVGHSPGAPFYMLVGNLFTQLAADASQVSRMVNLLNALLSAGCILFLFWSITRLVRSLITKKDQGLSTTDALIILGAGGVGALAYTFSDTFWFSAVEGEVYAFSSFLTALVFWIILRWQDESDSIRGDRWIILIAYIIGLSIGVHLLNLLCIPAIVLVFYYRKNHSISFKRIVGAIIFSAFLVLFILFVYIPGVAEIGGGFELLFVNVLGGPFHSGLIAFPALTSLLLLGAIHRFRKRVVHTTLWSLLMLSSGYTSYAVILIRANANTPLNENAPDTIFTLKNYLNREQYENAPLLYGKSYASEPVFVRKGSYYQPQIKEGSPIYRPDKEERKYKIIGHQEEYEYAQNMFFPRMWKERMASSYENWLGGIKGTQVPTSHPGGEGFIKIPTQKENLAYFFTYQLQHMYWRYFLWNFVGRQNDVQGHGEPEHGNWITGIHFLDRLRLGDQELLPDSLRQNKGHNVFYALPLLLGLVGIYWQITKEKKGKQQFSVLFLLFFMTGLAIVIYLNQDTEGVRRDARICNLSYAQTDWYIYQQQCPLYEAPGLPISWDRSLYQEGQNEYVVTRPELKMQIKEFYQKHPNEAHQNFGDDPFEIKNILKYWVFSKNQEFHVIPTDTLSMRIDKEAVLRSGIMLPQSIRHLKGKELRNALPDKIYICLKNRNILTKVDLLTLEILANCNWERPLYMAISVGNAERLQFDNYFVQEGLAYRFTPFDYKKLGDTDEDNGYAIDTEKLYENVMLKYKYGGLDKPGLYLDETNMRLCYSHRKLFALLATQLIKQQDTRRAKAVLDYGEQAIPAYNVPEVYESGSFDLAIAYTKLGEKEKAIKLLNYLTAEAEDYINWAFSLAQRERKAVQEKCMYKFWQWDQFNKLMKEINKENYKNNNQRFEEKYTLFSNSVNH